MSPFKEIRQRAETQRERGYYSDADAERAFTDRLELLEMVEALERAVRLHETRSHYFYIVFPDEPDMVRCAGCEALDKVGR